MKTDVDRLTSWYFPARFSLWICSCSNSARSRHSFTLSLQADLSFASVVTA